MTKVSGPHPVHIATAKSSDFKTLGRKSSPLADKILATYLEGLSSVILEEFMRPDFKSSLLIRKHFHRDFMMINAAVYECPLPQARSLEEHISNVEHFKKLNRHWRFSTYNPTALIQRGLLQAVVMITIKETGCEGNEVFERESVSMMHWSRQPEDGLWQCYKHSSLRGANFLLADQ